MWHISYWYRFSDDYWQETNSWKSKQDGSQHQDDIVPLSYFPFSVLNAFPCQIIQMERGKGRKNEKERVKQDQVSGKILELTSLTIYPTIEYSISFLNNTAAAKSLQSCPTLCDPIDGSPPGSTIPGSLQARTLEWVAISFSNAWKWKVKSESEVAQSCPTLSDPMDCSPPGSSIHGIFQARVLEWVPLPSS